MPKWLFDKLVAQMGEEETLLLADGMNKPAPLDLRVNALKANREDVIAKLAEAPIRQHADPVRAAGPARPDQAAAAKPAAVQGWPHRSAG
jgi:16S rRNA (cytosine967-C5)-methyltransferase